ncbi:MAG: hypothetical protein QM756_47610 [Polyangiaceae bacterium]
MRAASERVLGSSFARLGVAVAQTWRLPPRLLTSIAAVPSTSGPLTRPEDRLSALAEFANDLCEIVASASSGTREREISALLAHRKQLVNLSPKQSPNCWRQCRRRFRSATRRCSGSTSRPAAF